MPLDGDKLCLHYTVAGEDLHKEFEYVSSLLMFTSGAAVIYVGAGFWILDTGPTNYTGPAELDGPAGNYGGRFNATLGACDVGSSDEEHSVSLSDDPFDESSGESSEESSDSSGDSSDSGSYSGSSDNDSGSSDSGSDPKILSSLPPLDSPVIDYDSGLAWEWDGGELDFDWESGEVALWDSTPQEELLWHSS